MQNGSATNSDTKPQGNDFFFKRLLPCGLYWQHAPLIFHFVVTSLQRWEGMQNKGRKIREGEAGPKINNVTDLSRAVGPTLLAPWAG